MQDKDESGTLDRAEFENLMLTDAMQQKIGILGISVEEVDDMCAAELGDWIPPGSPSVLFRNALTPPAPVALGGARRFKVCDYTQTGLVIVHDLAEGLVQGLRPVTGKDILKLGQNGKRVTNALAENDRQARRAAGHSAGSGTVSVLCDAGGAGHQPSSDGAAKVRK